MSALINNWILQGIPTCKLNKMQILEVAVCLFIYLLTNFATRQGISTEQSYTMEIHEVQPQYQFNPMPYSFWTACGFFYLPQSYELWRVASLSSLSMKTRESNKLQMQLQRQHFLLSYLKTPSVCPAWFEPPTSRTVVQYSTKWANQLAVEQLLQLCSFWTTMPLYTADDSYLWVRVRRSLSHQR